MTAKHIAVIDYGMGNLHSVASALGHVAPEGTKISVTDSLSVVDSADHIIFPGVGAIRDCVSEIKRGGFHDAVAKALDAGKPVLAICVGMQSLLDNSEENEGVDCLGMVPGSVKLFSNNPTFTQANDESSASHERLKVPHMGWNEVHQTIEHPLWQGIPQDGRFYFVHSYYVEPANTDVVAAQTHYGIDFTSVIARKNLFAVQFHPEKSHTNGLQLLKNFAHWDGNENVS